MSADFSDSLTATFSRLLLRAILSRARPRLISVRLFQWFNAEFSRNAENRATGLRYLAAHLNKNAIVEIIASNRTFLSIETHPGTKRSAIQLPIDQMISVIGD
jgi:hypothetical protein